MGVPGAPEEPRAPAVARLRLIEVLQRCVDPTTAAYSRARAEAERLPPEIATAVFEMTLAEPIADALRTDARFRDGAGYTLRQPGADSGFYPDTVAVAMLRQVLAGGTADQALDWLDGVLGTEEAHGTVIAALWGVSVDGPVALTPSVQLVPIEALAPSAHRDRVLSRPRYSEGPPFPSRLELRRPTAALTTRVTLLPAIVPSGSSEPGWLAESAARTYGLLEEARLALSAVGPSAPLLAAAWFEYDSPALRQAERGTSFHGTIHEIVPWGFGGDVRLDGAQAAQITAAYVTLREPDKSRVTLALQRVNQAVRRHSDADRALELAIALEVLLTDGPGENTYKVGLRSALLSSGSQDERRQRRATIAALYNLRSAVAHTGKVPSKTSVHGVGRTASSIVIQEGMATVAAVARDVIQRGGIPHWYDFELGVGGQRDAASADAAGVEHGPDAETNSSAATGSDEQV